MTDQTPAAPTLTDDELILLVHQYVAWVHSGRPSTDPRQVELLERFFTPFNSRILNGATFTTPKKWPPR